MASPRRQNAIQWNRREQHQNEKEVLRKAQSTGPAQQHKRGDRRDRQIASLACSRQQVLQPYGASLLTFDSHKNARNNQARK